MTGDDRSMVERLRRVTKLVELLEELPADFAILALRGVHLASTNGTGPIAEKLELLTRQAILRRV